MSLADHEKDHPQFRVRLDAAAPIFIYGTNLYHYLVAAAFESKP